MKKKIAAIVLITGLTVGSLASTASAGFKGNRGNWDCPQMGMQARQPLDEATQAKLSQFRQDNQALFKEMVMKRTEKRALMRGDNPDPKLAAQLAGEIFDLRATIRVKAEEAGLAQYIGPMMGRGDCFGGKGPGRGNGGGQGRMMR